MFSRALIPKLKVFDFCVLKGQSQDKVSLCKKFLATFCKSEKPILHLEPPCLKSHNFLTADFKNLKAVGET
jgi:hypothetical protein